MPPIDLLMTWGWVKMALAPFRMVGCTGNCDEMARFLVNMYCSSHSYKMEAVNLNVGGKQREPRREFK